MKERRELQNIEAIQKTELQKVDAKNFERKKTEAKWQNNISAVKIHQLKKVDNGDSIKLLVQRHTHMADDSISAGFIHNESLPKKMKNTHAMVLIV